MKAFYFDRKNKSYKLETGNDPETVGDNDVLVKIKSASINFRDLIVLNDSDKLISSDSIIPVSDACAEVIKIGSRVNDFNIGDRVIPAFYQDWDDGSFKQEYATSALGIGSTNGVLCELRKFNSKTLIKAPDGYTDQEISTLPCAALTAWHALFNYPNAQLKPGDTILTIGTGGVSLFSILFALNFGLNVVSLTSSKSKAERLKRIGVKNVVIRDEKNKWVETVRELTNGEGVDRVIDTAGSTLVFSSSCLRIGGSIAVVGASGGNNPVLSPYDILGKSISLYGVRVGSIKMLKEMVRALEVNKIKPVIDRVFDFNDSNKAIEFLSSGEHFGKIVIQVFRDEENK